jgi:nucleoside 2-deoxyribosyltransferase
VTQESTCPICARLDASLTRDQPDPATNVSVCIVDCPRCGSYRISERDEAALVKHIPAMLDPDRADQPRVTAPGVPAAAFPLDRLHLVSGYLRELTERGKRDTIVSPESAWMMADTAAGTVPERSEKLLLTLAAMSRFAGERHAIDGPRDRSLAYSTSGGELMFLLHHLLQDELLDGPPVRSDPPIFDWVAVSLKGWTRVEQLRAGSMSLTQAFVAMTFDPGLEWIYTESIAPAIEEAGYRPLILSRHEHADRVDERIVLELNRSRFVVAEFAQHRPSVYFEAGYAVGRGLPVIWTCRADDYERAHFDTRQYNHIVWRTAEELRDRLHTRIKVVVG